MMRKDKLLRRDSNLEIETVKQWLDNHAEYCGAQVPPWPHPGICKCPLPQVIAELTPNKVYSLLLRALEARN